LTFRLLIELFFGIAGGWAVHRTTYCWGVEEIRAAASTFVSLAGTLLGFVITALSIFMAVGNAVLMENLRKTGHSEVLIKDMFVTSAFFGISLILSLVPVFSSDNSLLLFLSAGVGVFVMASLRLTVAGQRFYRVMVSA